MSGNKKEMGEKKEVKKNDVDDNITKRYELKKRLGKGAYGIVWKALDKRQNEVVAVKKIFDAFRNQTDAQRTFREIMFLQAFKDHANIITLRGIHKATNNRDIYLVFDYMDSDLHHVIKKETVLKDVHKRYIMYQLFRATRYLHSGNVIHRDQKPSNILINSDCRIKIADFGLARSLTHTGASNEELDDGILTDYVATRWYRAPEILVASKKYTKGVDMWSLGCILGEMLLGKPLFPGTSTVNQMERIMAVLPEPSPQEIYNMCSGYGKGLLEGKVGPRSSLRELMKSPDEEAIDLVTKLLVFDPNKRLTATEALNHPYVATFRNGREQTLNCNVIPPLDDDVQLTVSEYRNKLYEMMAASVERKRLSQTSSQTEQIAMNGYKERTRHATDYGSQRGQGDSRYVEEHRSTRYKSKCHSSEDFRDRGYGSRLNPVHKSDSAQAVTGNIKKSANSPQHRPGVPPKGTFGWSDRQRLLCSSVKTPVQLKPRSEDGSGDGYHQHREISSGHGQQPFKAAIAQVKEKLKAQTNTGHLSTLPKVTSKRPIQKQSSTLQATRHSSKNVITTSALQEIRSALKH